MKSQHGMSLIEVMVAVAILGSGLLGLAAMQGRALAQVQSAHYRSVAADLAADLGDRIRANRSPFIVMEAGALHASFALPPNFANCSQSTGSPASVTCTPQSGGRQSYRVAAEMGEWNSALREQLPNGRFTLQSVAASNVANTPGSGLLRYTLTITWADDRKSASPDFSYVTVIE
ncbi:type IV pilus modification protein PilV [Azonexus fungiphilus]|uniref:type IV pilus modification protein PilV n=1 Tax=Azonexus fungiphilus TaxID=146940 RepID=UPI000EB1AB98|nr:type IV pilus modification protein PilV [Azonexus fungiphilus]